MGRDSLLNEAVGGKKQNPQAVSKQQLLWNHSPQPRFIAKCDILWSEVSLVNPGQLPQMCHLPIPSLLTMAAERDKDLDSM